MAASNVHAVNRARYLAKVEEYNKSPELCGKCKKPLSYRSYKLGNKFCGESCWYDSKRTSPLPKKERRCSCGAPSTVGKCRACYLLKHPLRMSRLEDATTDRTRRNILIRLHGNKCWSCGLSEWMGSKMPVELEHKDGNSDNNSEGNLSLICPNCHALTPTYKGKNKGNGKRQLLRRERYSSGKTF